MRVSAGPYTLDFPPNGVAVLYEADAAGNDHQLPGGVGYLDALIQFAGEVIRLQAILDARPGAPAAARRTDMMTEPSWDDAVRALREQFGAHGAADWLERMRPVIDPADLVKTVENASPKDLASFVLRMVIERIRFRIECMEERNLSGVSISKGFAQEIVRACQRALDALGEVAQP